MVRAGSEQPDATLALAVAGFLDSCRSANTQAAYRTDLAHLAAWCRGRGKLDLLTVDAADIARYRTECESSGASPATVARRLCAIASFSAYTAAHGDVAVTLAEGNIARPTLAATSSAELLSDHDADALLASADDAGPRAAVAIRLLMLDGLKVGEVIRADAADVRGRSNTTLDLHSSPSRTITLHRETGAAIRTYLGRRRDGPLLLSERRGRTPARLSRFGLDYLVKQTAQAAGLDQAVSGNTLRRRYVNAAHTHGADLDTIRRNTGHTDVRTIRRYLPHERDLDDNRA
jgi:site-specific recombinase XerD